MMESVDMTDLKSVEQKCSCGFKSHSEYNEPSKSYLPFSERLGPVYTKETFLGVGNRGVSKG